MNCAVRMMLLAHCMARVSGWMVTRLQLLKCLKRRPTILNDFLNACLLLLLGFPLQNGLNVFSKSFKLKKETSFLYWYGNISSVFLEVSLKQYIKN